MGFFWYPLLRRSFPSWVGKGTPLKSQKVTGFSGFWRNRGKKSIFWLLSNFPPFLNYFFARMIFFLKFIKFPKLKKIDIRFLWIFKIKLLYFNPISLRVLVKIFLSHFKKIRKLKKKLLKIKIRILGRAGVENLKFFSKNNFFLIWLTFIWLKN